MHVDDIFEIAIDISTDVSGLTPDDFDITNGTILTDLSNVGTTYYVSVEPSSNGIISIQLPADKVQDADGNGNLISNVLEFNYTKPGTGGSNPTVNLRTASLEVEDIFEI